MTHAIHLPIKESATLRSNALASERRARGLSVYNLSAGEPMVAPHPRIIEAATKALSDGKTLYTPPAGIPELRSAFADWMNSNHRTNFTASNVVVTPGGKFALFALFQILVAPRDEVLVPSPYWTSYTEMVKLFRGVPVIVPTTTEVGWKISAADIERYATAKTKILVINNGSNPTGALYNRDELGALIKTASERGILTVSDEVYSGLCYDNAPFVSAAEFAQFSKNIVVIQSVSKHFAMTGWRVGAALGPTDIVSAIATLQSQSTSGTSGISQYAAVGALTHAAEVNNAVKSEMQKRRDIFVQTFNELFTSSIEAPQAGLYCFFPLTTIGIKNANDLAASEELLEKTGVALVPGSAFGAPGYVRASFGAEPSEFVAGLKELKNF